MNIIQNSKQHNLFIFLFNLIIKTNLQIICKNYVKLVNLIFLLKKIKQEIEFTLILTLSYTSKSC